VSHGLILFVCFTAQVIGVISIVCLFAPGLRFAHHQLLSLLLPEQWTILRLGYWLWPLLVLVAAQVRTLLVQYVGDVAAYVSPSKLDRFSEIREKIKGRANGIAVAIFSAEAIGGGGFEYGQVALVGHSLGSVISYDTLNRQVKDDELAGNPRNILGRTSLLLTFGSPLDKTAFIFALHGRESTQTRDALVTAVQPLLQDYRYRPFPWVNIWSPNDVISGTLDYFDATPPDPNHRVRNETDPEATIPLVAHTEYWKNRLVWEKLYEVLV